ncbi:copper resistance protein B [Caballeronia sp. GAFFF1]|uniref:copper resistance protein B n=1 Tax=Caballeronia sp. GAFFF1 TaxID=2921779 RepID=UPI0020289A3F|nr:copper resistance protein B [Caballeronia sp. GAFFF1]
MHVISTRCGHLLPAASLASAIAAALFLLPAVAGAHSVAGDRIFPSTMAVDDPGVGDEANLQFGHIRVPGDDGDQSINTFEFEYDKLITPRLAVSVGGAYAMQNNPTAHGFDNVEVGLKYLLYVNEAHEFMTSVGVSAELGGTGSRAIADSHSTISPTLYAGKGMGDLPDSLAYLRPVAITAEAGPALTTGSGQPNAFNYGFTVQYSLPYLQQHVRDVGLPQPFSNIVPLVEIPLSRSQGQTTGTVNPGFIWINRYGQFGVEAQIPLNRASGSHVGILVQAHIFFDDVAPKTLGKPFFK